ncbi:ergothioneine biosynthesis protein EgtC [Paractinoplanes rishiriensis]|uniref:Gamma-glutamyl-hercynylcysteine sulfoxide hydrolase n=1 Tax=Paractinoplanes rishiriensis TaxID=1050105 RepID=A0A919K0F3_9ACTN|nr:ergothioneine biosynthesis protein EgtC [Actinoplanes rishiriensis]GIE98611.1 gamma-glutamyl-hercynylcysteine sulfoxide hydrolase [Actinoplanes rishiriensis]
MCRHLAYLGPPIPLSHLLFDPPHALSHQSWSPTDMRGGGTVNADGFGVGWYPAPAAPAPAATAPGGPPSGGPPSGGPPSGGPVPVLYRRDTPLWSDATLPRLAASVTAGAVLAAVRSATVGMPVAEPAAAPFGDGPWLFSHNGVVAGWPGSVAKLAGALPVTDLLTLPAPTDSALLWLLVRDRLRAGAAPAEAVRDTVAEVERAAPGSRLNLLLTDGVSLVATTAGHALSVFSGAGSVLVSSEPLDDDPGWRAVPDRTLLTATAGDVALTTLGVL